MATRDVPWQKQQADAVLLRDAEHERAPCHLYAREVHAAVAARRPSAEDRRNIATLGQRVLLSSLAAHDIQAVGIPSRGPVFVNRSRPAT